MGNQVLAQQIQRPSAVVHAKPETLDAHTLEHFAASLTGATWGNHVDCVSGSDKGECLIPHSNIVRVQVILEEHGNPQPSWLRRVPTRHWMLFAVGH
jgi:hypothetical protein